VTTVLVKLAATAHRTVIAAVHSPNRRSPSDVPRETSSSGELAVLATMRRAEHAKLRQELELGAGSVSSTGRNPTCEIVGQTSPPNVGLK
jgi:hypothetical protein